MKQSLKNVGVWVDNREAVIITLSGGQIQEQVYYSGIDPRPRFEGEVSLKKKRSLKGFDFESSQKRHLQERQKEYHKLLAQKLQGATALYLLGPADARIKLEKVLNNTTPFKGRILASEACDYITRNQIIERVRNFFYKNSGLAATQAGGIKRRLPNKVIG